MTAEKINLIIYIAQHIGCLGALAAFTYGLVVITKFKKPMYIKIVVMSIACVALSKLFDIFSIFLEGTIRDGFGLGRLGVLGAFLGFLSANYGQMDSIIDERGKETLVPRLLALIAPLFSVCTIVSLYFSKATVLEYIFFTLVFIVMAFASYYNLKHIFINDALGLAKSIRVYNVLALGFAVLSIVEILAFVYGNYLPYCIATIGEGLILPFIIISLNRGVSRWFK